MLQVKQTCCYNYHFIRLLSLLLFFYLVVKLQVIIVFCCVFIVSECNSSEWQVVVSNGSNLIYSWYIDSKLTAVTTNNRVNVLFSVALLCNAEQGWGP